MVTIQNKKTGDKIEVPVAHWDHVLKSQGNYELCQQPSIDASSKVDVSEPFQPGMANTDTSAILMENPTQVTVKRKKAKRRARKKAVRKQGK